MLTLKVFGKISALDPGKHRAENLTPACRRAPYPYGLVHATQEASYLSRIIKLATFKHSTSSNLSSDADHECSFDVGVLNDWKGNRKRSNIRNAMIWSFSSHERVVRLARFWGGG